MKTVLLGATGLTGREVLDQALEGGHEVKAVVRKPEQIKVEHANLAWSFVFGPPVAIRDVTQDSLLQRTVEDGQLGRVYATR